MLVLLKMKHIKMKYFICEQKLHREEEFQYYVQNGKFFFRGKELISGKLLLDSVVTQVCYTKSAIVSSRYLSVKIFNDFPFFELFSNFHYYYRSLNSIAIDINRRELQPWQDQITKIDNPTTFLDEFGLCFSSEIDSATKSVNLTYFVSPGDESKFNSIF